MKLMLGLSIAASLAMISAVAAAEDSGPLDLFQPSPQVIQPNSMPRAEHVYSRYAIVLDVPILWAQGATLEQDVVITAGSDSRALIKGAILQGAILTDKTKSARIPAYCTPRVAAERKADKGFLGAMLGGGSLWRGMIKGATDRQYCLIDADRDGLAERSVLINAGTPQARTALPISPVRLTPQALLPISKDDHVTIALSDISKKGKDATFTIDVIQQGESRMFTSIGSTKKITIVDMRQGSARQTLYGATFDVVQIDGAAQTATIRWPEKMDASATAIVDDGLRVTVRFN